MTKPLTLSIVIPVHNEESHIKACLDAISVQDRPPLEVIVVNNNCTDSTVALAAEYPFVRIVNESRPGIAHARNAGFNAVKGEIIGRIDADTRLPKNWVRIMSNFATKHPDSALTGGAYFYDLKPGGFFGWIQGQVAFRMNRFIIGHYITWGSNLAFRRELWDEVKAELHNDKDIHEDMDLGMHLHDKGYRITYKAGLKVGIDSRLFSRKRRTRKQHLAYLKMWPRTLSKHGYKRVWVGWLGVYIVYFSYYPFFILHWASQKLEK